MENLDSIQEQLQNHGVDELKELLELIKDNPDEECESIKKKVQEILENRKLIIKK